MAIAQRATDALLSFSKARDWGQFHTPENLSKSIAIEAAELLECFQWSNEFDLEEIKGELADVVSYCILLAQVTNIDLTEAILEKVALNESRYPLEKSTGTSTKYDRL
ncbi:hypothetical protein CKALI_03195 [Corynebacterium kalinowskii]|uniref:Nucleotide pyrophosphohydrolase n=1 Tax=Corynebacterium kalinowskii TaxID=2675216 RepID=A0A6B8V8Y2_9CORY|nr:nucleotide pyrophosphohydrolase [Corynebacterium kalinowskii]QGU01522.1 hypothetical protein CKALI_03195 [Corynebacterium kalinowskii]